MNYELMKKAYEDFNGVWPYGDCDSMVVATEKNKRTDKGAYSRSCSIKRIHSSNSEWSWVGTKADFNAYSESLNGRVMNEELIKKAYKIYGGVWVGADDSVMIVSSSRNPEWGEGRYEFHPYTNRDLFYRDHGEHWQWVATKSEFEAFVDSVKNNINWDEAPEGATAYYEGGMFPWLKTDNGLFYHYSSLYNQWIESADEDKGRGRYEFAVKKPQDEPAAWQPKVGEECEVLHGDEWIISIYLGIDIYGSYAYQIAEGDYKGEFNADKNINNFRPIKTERDQLIEIIDSCNMSSGVLADVILNAGYRKIEEGK